MNIKNKLFATLLIFVFLISVSAVVAEETTDVSDNLAVGDANENIPLSDDSDIEETPGEEETTTGVDYEETSLSVKVEVLDKDIKVGDKFRVKISVKNIGENHAEDVVAGFSFTDLQENMDNSFKLVDDGGYAVSPFDGGYIVEFGFLGAGDYEDVILTFLATEAGEKHIFASVSADNSVDVPSSFDNTTITVSADSENNIDNNNVKSAASKALPATGNPLALLAIALVCIVPYCRKR